MSFSRTTPSILRDSELDDSIRSIGMRIGPGRVSHDGSDLELALVSASIASIPHDFRLLGVLVAWLEAHHAYVNVPRLKRTILRADGTKSVRAFWSSVGAWLGVSDSRWRSLVSLHRGPPVSLDDPDVTELHIARVGADPRFEGSALVVPAKLLRSRPSDVDDPATLVMRHRLYRARVRFGPTYRADVWAALEASPESSPAQIARQVGCAYESARSVAIDFRLDRSAMAS